MRRDSQLDMYLPLLLKRVQQQALQNSPLQQQALQNGPVRQQALQNGPVRQQASQNSPRLSQPLAVVPHADPRRLRVTSSPLVSGRSRWLPWMVGVTMLLAGLLSFARHGIAGQWF
jgi:hypothetical protein